MMKKQVLDYIESKRDEMLTLWEQFVNVESGRDHIPGIDYLIDRVAHILEDEGFHTRIIPYQKAGNAVVAEYGNVENEAPIIFIGHVDTVFPQGFLADHPFQIKDGKAYGPGVADMKGGVVSILYAVKALRASAFDRHPLKVIIVGDEEDAHTQSEAKSMIVNESRGGLYSFNAETGSLDNKLSIGRAGGSIYELEVFGAASHTGSEWEKGRNAIIELSKKMLDIDRMSDHPSGYTFNVTLVEGGTTPNTCPDYAKATIGTRCQTQAQKNKMHDWLEDVCAKTYTDGTETILSYQGGFDPMEVTEESRALFERIKKTAEELNMEKPTSVIGQGSSDSAYTALAGVPTVCSLGPVGAGNHTEHEYALVESLFERCKLLAVSVLK